VLCVFAVVCNTVKDYVFNSVFNCVFA